MSAEAAVQTATLLQNKVGSSLAGVTNLLTPEQRSDTLVQAGASSLSVVVLDELKELQKQTYECVEKVATLLQTQIDIAKENSRRQRDQAAELRKEKSISGVTGKPVGAMPTSGADMGIFGLTGDKLKNLLTLGFGSIFTIGALKSAFKMFGKRLLKGGAVASLVSLIAEPIVNFINDEFDLELDDQAKKDLETSLVGSAAGYYLGGIPGAIIGSTIPYISRVSQYIAGKLNADEVKDSDFAMTGIGATTAGVYTAGKLGKLMAMSKLPAVKTLGMALASTPFLLAIGIGIAAGVGASFLAKKIDEYQEMTLKKLKGTVEKLDKEMGEWAARQEEGLFERFGINMGTQSALGEAKIAAQEANEQVQQDKNKFLANTEVQENLRGLKDAMLGYSDDAISTILQDSTKATNFMTTIENLQSIASKGGFGKDSQAIFESLAAFSDRVQNVAIRMVDDGITGGKVKSVALNKEGLGGDQLENLKGNEEARLARVKEIEDFKALIQIEKDKLQKMADEGQGYDNIKGIYSNDFERLDRDIGKMEDELAKKIKRLDKFDADANKFNTTNGLLYNLDELQELYKGDEEKLKAIIERSINQQGTSFLNEQIKLNENSKKDVSTNMTIQDNKTQNQNNNVSQAVYVNRLNPYGDKTIVREGYSYGL